MLNLLLILIFIRPFISYLAFPSLDSLYSALILSFSLFWMLRNSISLKKLQPIKYPLLLFCIALIISIIFSVNRANSIGEIYKYGTGIILLILAAHFSDTQKDRFIYAIIFSGIAVSCFAIYQYFFGFRHLLNYLVKQNIVDPFVLDYVMSRRTFFPFVSPNILGGFVAMTMPLALACKHKLWIILPLGVTLLLTKSLSALFALFLGLMIYLYLQKKINKKMIILLCGIFASLMMIFMIRTAYQKEYLQPFYSITRRLGYWEDTLMLIKLHPFVGVGLGNFNLMESRFAHNFYLQLWAEAGILPFIAFFWLIGSVLKCDIRNIKESFQKNQMVVLVTAIEIFLIDNFLNFSFFLPEVNFFWCVIIGLFFSLYNRS